MSESERTGGHLPPQGDRIRGYRELTADEIDLVNRIKAKGDELGDLCAEAERHIQAQYEAAGTLVERGCEEADHCELARLNAADPLRWRAAARTELQSGLMKLVRSVAQPGGF